MYNSCRCRFCPKCQTLTKERWLEKRKSEFIDTDYYHGVFTVPSELNGVSRQNQKIIYSILFKSVNETLQKFAQNEYKGKLGFISVLHTWNQKINYHLHLHCVIPGGVLLNKNNEWEKLRGKKFLFHVESLSKVFKSKFIKKLRKSFEKLSFHGNIEYLNNEASFNDFLDNLFQKKWVVYAKKSFGGAIQVIEYLGRYTHRVAISNYRIIKIVNDIVHFKYRDRRDNNKEKILELNVFEFLRRFMSHILPARFSKIRYNGFLANRYKKKNLEDIHQQLNTISPRPVINITLEEFVKKLTGREINECPHCKKLSIESYDLKEEKNPP